MRSVILKKLEDIQHSNNIKILYAVESGSRGWGFASKDSDYDVRFIYIRSADWYLSIDERKDFIEVPINDLLDINGWDIKKALQQYKRSNPTLMEWLSSPIVYIESYSTAKKMRELLPDYFSPVPTIYHYLHTAKNKFEEVLNSEKVKIKRYFYILRPVLACMWIEKYDTAPPMEFCKLLKAQTLDNSLMDEIGKLLCKKMSGIETDIENKNPIIMDFLENKITHFDRYLNTVRKEKKSGYEALNDLFNETLKEAWGHGRMEDMS